MTLLSAIVFHEWLFRLTVWLLALLVDCRLSLQMPATFWHVLQRPDRMHFREHWATPRIPVGVSSRFGGQRHPEQHPPQRNRALFPPPPARLLRSLLRLLQSAHAVRHGATTAQADQAVCALFRGLPNAAGDGGDFFGRFPAAAGAENLQISPAVDGIAQAHAWGSSGLSERQAGVESHEGRDGDDQWTKKTSRMFGEDCFVARDYR